MDDAERNHEGGDDPAQPKKILIVGMDRVGEIQGGVDRI